MIFVEFFLCYSCPQFLMNRHYREADFGNSCLTPAIETNYRTNILSISMCFLTFLTPLWELSTGHTNLYWWPLPPSPLRLTLSFFLIKALSYFLIIYMDNPCLINYMWFFALVKCEHDPVQQKKKLHKLVTCSCFLEKKIPLVPANRLMTGPQITGREPLVSI